MEDKKLPIIDDYETLGRRDLLRQWGPPVIAGVALAGLGFGFNGREGRHRPVSSESLSRPRDWRTEPTAPGRLATSCGKGPAENLRLALAAMGGIETFVKPGERVAIKPNCAWDRKPEQAANTDPALIGELTLNGVNRRVVVPARITYLPESEKTRKRLPGDLLGVARSSGSISACSV